MRTTRWNDRAARRMHLWAAVVLMSGMASVGEPEISSSREVAPQADGTRAQAWAAIAWSEHGKNWLVVWREGYLNEAGTEIWCARVDEKGQPLDPQGIKLAGGPGIRSDVKVASDGRDWLVVWGELASGKDWDIRGQLVGLDGKKKGEPFTVVEGPNNQCQPAVAFAAGAYHVVYSAFSGAGLPNTPGNGYALYGARVSRDGKLLETVPRQLVGNKGMQSHYPTIATDGESLAVVFESTRHSVWGGESLNRVLLDAKTGAVKAGELPPARSHRDVRMTGGAITPRWLPVACSGEGFLTVVRCMEGFGGRPPYLGKVLTLSSTGELKETPVVLNGLRGVREGRQWYSLPKTALAFDGERFLFVMESLSGNDNSQAMGIVGWYVAKDGGSIVHGNPRGGFAIATEDGKTHVLPTVCGGPKGVCLVVNSELRGVDDMKLVARLVHYRVK